MTERPPFIAIAAVDDDMGIARGGTLPWHVPSDLKRFRRLTVGAGRNAIVMGRLTWQSIEVAQRPLPKRLNIVMSRTPFEAPGAIVVSTWDAVIDATRDSDTVWVVGGAQIYTAAFEADLTDAIELTRIAGRFDCDLHFPAIPADFVRITQTTRSDGDHQVTDERWERGRARKN